MTPSEALVGDARTWRAAVSGRAPAYHRLFEELERLLESEGEAGDRARSWIDEAWAERTFSVFYERPLLFAAAIRDDALARSEAHPLWRAVGADAPDPGSVTREALLSALASEDARASMASRFVQTNEPTRAVAWLWPAHLVGCDGGKRPIALVELGCSAGLNLVADRLPPCWRDTRGAPLPTVSDPDVRVRIGIDLRPLSVLDPRNVRWMRACIWPGEHERLARFDAGVAAFRAADPRPSLEAGNLLDAGERLARVSAEAAPDALVIALQTIVRDYLDARANEAYERAMKGWLAAAPPGRALWLELEIDAVGDRSRPAAIRAHTAGEDLVLARTGFHPETVDADADAVSALRRSLASPA